jgi:hypothetical protein
MARTKKSKKTIKMRRRNTRKNKKMHKKGGIGMLTPPGSPIQQQGSPNFIDVDTPGSQGSLHLSDLETTDRNSESGYTTGDSGMSGLNLTQQFDDASDNLTATEGEDSMSSMDDNAVPGQPGNMANLDLTNGGKRRTRRNKKSRKSRRHRRR